jgi:site-specific recombinase XerD
MAEPSTTLAGRSLELSPELAKLARESDEDAERALAENSRRGYAYDWKTFRAFCAHHKLDALPADPQTIAMYYRHLANLGRKFATIDRARAGIRHYHRDYGYTSPTDDPQVEKRLRGIANNLGRANTQKAALLDEHLRKIIRMIDKRTLMGKRDRALLVFGWCTAMRGSAICNVDVEHLSWSYDDDGIELLDVYVPRSKTDQTGKGKTKRLARFDDPDIEPIDAVRDWLGAIGNPTSGPLFLPLTPDSKHVMQKRLTSRTVSRIVQKHTGIAELNGSFASHSIKRGVLSSGARAQLSMNDLMKTGDHVTPQPQYFDDAILAADLPITRIVQRRKRTGVGDKQPS